MCVLPVDDTRNLGWVFRVNEDISTVQVFMPKDSRSSDGVSRRKVSVYFDIVL